MAMFGGDAVPASAFEMIMQALERERERSHQVTMEALELKRHDLGMVPKGWAPPVDPMSLLGPLTQVAIEEFAAGDPELRLALLRRATVLAEAHRAKNMDSAESDEEIAALIQAGDS